MSITRKRRQGSCAIVLAAIAAVAWLTALGGSRSATRVSAAEPEPLPFTALYYASISQRFGVGLDTGITVSVGGEVRNALITDYDVGGLHIGWYSDWWSSPHPLRPGGIRYAQLIQVRASAYPTNTKALTETIDADTRGSLWIVGNEPECPVGQGNRTPGEYARIYHDVYALIKRLDSTAPVAIGGVVEPTPLRLQWLDAVLAEYQRLYGEPMPVDVWNIHVQVLQELPGSWGAGIPFGLAAQSGVTYTLRDNANPVLFRELVLSFRQWMKERGFQDRPLIISEYGVLMPSTYLVESGNEAEGNRKLIDFMQETFAFLVNARDPGLGYAADDGRLVQQWLWYSLNDEPYDLNTGRGFNGSLFSYRDPTRITPFGVALRSYVHLLLSPRVLLPVIRAQRAVE